MTPQFSLVAGYRNRDLPRVKCFLDSLQNQTFHDFELIFVDYGSDQSLSTGVSALCASYDFCQYVFCDTRGKVWNRAHALNIGIQRATGKYFLSTDIDLIYSQDVLSHLISNCREESQIFCTAFLLPKTFRDYARLLQMPVDFPLTKPNTLGLFHCVLMEHVRRIHGYDEFYKIWGFEDKDFARRLEDIGVKSLWLDEKQNPIYHQWHPAGSIHVFMQWWWEDMTVHDGFAEYKYNQHSNWGECISTETRPLRQARETMEYACAADLNPFERRACIVHILNLLRNNPDKVIAVELRKESSGLPGPGQLQSRAIIRLANAVNRSLRYMGSTLQLRAFDTSFERTTQSMLYFFYRLIFSSDTLADYSIDESRDTYRFLLVYNSGEA